MRHCTDCRTLSVQACRRDAAYDELTEAEKALSLRVIWMRRMGLDEDEITDSLRSDPPFSIHEEMTELLALEKLKTITPPVDVLRKIAIKY